MVETKIVSILPPKDAATILGQSHFIKTVEDIGEALVNAVPGIQYGLAFNESSGPRLVRSEGNDEELTKLAVEKALEIGAGHAFVLFIRNAFPINVLRALREVPELVTLYAASANPLQVMVAQTEQGRGILGVVDGESPLGVEDEERKKERHAFLRKIGYKR